MNEVHVYVDDDDPEDFYLGEIIRGDHVDKVLQSLLYEPADLVRRVKTALDARMKDGSIRPKEGVGLSQFYEGVMRGYTYLHGMQVEAGPTNAPDPALPPAPPSDPAAGPGLLPG
ncbi:MAG: arginine decarboxylase [Anaeromyxobacteraceae bacterium]|nr:arginine decarboxylase [Anaeromyxobacteraceae bacterium]